MGSFHGAEGCELVGLFLLSQLDEVKFNGGLYRDDGLGVLDGTKRQNEVIKKKICDIFRKNQLKITVEVNMKIVDFLDVTLDLERDKFCPFMKPNNVLEYVNVKSNHPPSITKNIPESVNKRLNNLSADEHTFIQAIPPYQEALDKAGHKFKLHFVPPQDQPPRKKENKGKLFGAICPIAALLKKYGKRIFFKILKQCF